MERWRSLVVMLAVLAAACAGDVAPATSATVPPTATPPTVTAAPDTYIVEFDVKYEDWFRVPGSGVVPREMEATYHVGPVALAPGEATDVESTGEITWTVRCHEGLPAFDARLRWEESTREAVDFSLDEASLSSVRDPDPAAQWLAGPGLGIVHVGDDLAVVHRLPAGHDLEPPLPECDGTVRAMLVFGAGAGAMTQPSITTGDHPQPRSPAAVLAGQDPPAYLDGEGAAGGWVVHLLDGDGTIDFSRESIDEMGGYRLVITGSVIRQVE